MGGQVLSVLLDSRQRTRPSVLQCTLGTDRLSNSDTARRRSSDSLFGHCRSQSPIELPSGRCRPTDLRLRIHLEDTQDRLDHLGNNGLDSSARPEQLR